MLYDGALKFMEGARQGFEEKGIGSSNEQINNNLVRAQSILYELRGVLNHEIESEGDLSRKLEALYTYMIEQLSEANIKKDPARIAEVKTHLLELRNAWNEMLKKSEQSSVENAGMSCSA